MRLQGRLGAAAAAALMVSVGACGSGQSTGRAASGGAAGSNNGGSAGAGANGGVGAGGNGGVGGTTGPITLHPDNILNNGDFEAGLMCWNDWVWSNTGQDYKGDYDFLLSTDAHTGSYSLEIACQGTDCLKAAIFTHRIFTPPSQAYKLTLYSKCAAGADAVAYLPNTASGELFHTLNCTGSWENNTVDFSADASGTPLLVYVYNRSTSSLLIDDVVLTYADGSVPVQTIQHPGKRSTAIDGQTVTVDGSPYLALGFFDVPYADLDQIAKLGANTAVELGLEQGADCFNTEQQGYLDKAYDLGIGVVPDSTTSARLDTPQVFPTVMRRFAPHLANVAWLLDDEPDQADVSWYYIKPQTLVAEHDAAKTATTLPIFADMQRASWSTSSEVSPYAGGVDAWMAEPYGTNFSGVDHAVTMFDSIAKRPIWLAQDAIGATYIVPKAWYVITRGATGIIYFSWKSFKSDSAKLAATQQAFNEIGSLKDVIFAQPAQVTPPAGIAATARSYQGKTYVFAVNPTSQTVQGTFSVPGLAAGASIDVQFENRTLTATAGHFTDGFAGVSRHVYVIN